MAVTADINQRALSSGRGEATAFRPAGQVTVTGVKYERRHMTPEEARTGRLQRVLRVLGALLREPDGLGMRALCRELQVSRRTVFRYLEQLQEAGVPVLFDRKHLTYRLGRAGAWAANAPSLQFVGTGQSHARGACLKEQGKNGSGHTAPARRGGMTQYACVPSAGPERADRARSEAGGAATKIAFARYLIDQGLVSPEDISRLPADAWHAEDSLGRIARYHRLMDDLEVVQVLVQQENTKAFFGETAVQQGRLSAAQLDMLLAGQSMRACIELVETLVFAGCLDQTAAMAAVAQYLPELRVDADRPS